MIHLHISAANLKAVAAVLPTAWRQILGNTGDVDMRRDQAVDLMDWLYCFAPTQLGSPAYHAALAIAGDIETELLTEAVTEAIRPCAASVEPVAAKATQGELFA